MIYEYFHDTLDDSNQLDRMEIIILNWMPILISL